MQTLTKLILEHQLGNRFITTGQLERLVGGSDKRRYGLVNRALKEGELIKIKRGVHMLGKKYRTHPAHPFAIAQALVPGSYVSFETALSFHGWIPERAFSTASVSPGRQSREYENETLGVFTFHPLSITKGCFLTLVNRYQTDGQTMLVAEAARALLDLVCLRKIEWKSMSWLSEGLRIDPGALNSRETGEQLETMQGVYKNRRMQRFIGALLQEISFD